MIARGERAEPRARPEPDTRTRARANLVVKTSEIGGRARHSNLGDDRLYAARAPGVVAALTLVTIGIVPIRVVLADDSVAMRDVLAEMLGRSPDIVVVATADDEPTLLAAVDECRPDVVVTDVRMPPTGTDEGVRVAAHLATAQPHIGVVIVSQYSDPGWLSRVFDQGSKNRGWVMKERAHTGGQLISAVKAVHQGDRWIDASVMASE